MGGSLNHLRVTAAKDRDGMEIPKDTRFSFVVDATGASSVGFMAQAGIGKVDLSWHSQNLSNLMGYNMYRYHQINDSTYSDTLLVNTTMISDTVFSDKTVQPNITYYYMYTGVSTDFKESDYSDPSSARPFDADPGDANGDMSVNVLDVISVVSYILQESPLPFLFKAADMNNDGAINVLDVIGVVNVILHGLPKIAGVNATETIFAMNQNQMTNSSNGSISGYQFKVAGNVKDLAITSLFPFEMITRRIARDTLIVIGYSQDMSSLPDGNCPILSFSSVENLTFYDLIVADRSGKSVKSHFGKSGETLVPEKFQLSQNYPNPFNSTTTFRYALPKTSDVSFTIYNILGERVYEMRQSNQMPGYYQFVWNGLNQKGLNVASGVYFYQLTAGKFTDKKKMVILK